MKRILVSILLFASFTFAFACRSLDSASNDSLASVSSDGPPACSAEEAKDSSELKGSGLFDLTGRCVFGEEAHTIKIRILSETFQKVLDDGCAGEDSGYGHILALELDGHVLEDVGIKVRGNTSKCNTKRQFKFSFNETKLFSKFQGTLEEKSFPQNKGRTFFGLEGLSVRASANDPTMLREKISSELFGEAAKIAATTARGSLVYRVGFAKIFVSFNRRAAEGPEGNFKRLIDGYYYDYKGFYSLTENIDKVFLKSRFQIADEKVKDYHLYEADQALARFERATYNPDGWSFTYFKGDKVKTDEQKAGAEAFLLSSFDSLRDRDADLAALYSIDSVANYVAGAILIGHWDSLLANANNDYLYYDPPRKAFQLIAWDLDNSLGTNDELFRRFMADDIYAPGKENAAKLFQVLFAPERPEFRKALAQRLKDLVGGFYSRAAFEAYVDRLEAFVRRNAESWELADPAAFQAIKDFAKTRRDKVAAQLP